MNCKLFAPGCVTTYASAYPTGRLSFPSSTPTSLFADVSSHDSWDETVCVQCTNDIVGPPAYSLSTWNYDNYKVYQTENPCHTSLSANVALVNPTSFAYNAAGDETIGDYTTFISNSVVGDCDATSCVLFAPGCSTLYSTSNPSTRITLSAMAPFTMTAKRD